MIPFRERLSLGRPLLLDGATGTELSRRGVNVDVPSWSAAAILTAPEQLLQIHRDYVEAGAEVITANTFRTHARSLRSLGWEGRAEELTRRAVEIARAATDGRCYVAGSLAPLGDCYTPAETPELADLAVEHATMARQLADAGVDLLLIETQLTIREACAAAAGAQVTGLPFAVSLVLGRDGNLLSGESLTDAQMALKVFQPDVVLVNCLPAEEVLPGLKPLLFSGTARHLGAYANTGRLMPNGSWEATSGELPAVYAEFARGWKDAGLILIGGCCGTMPQHISAIRNVI
ncbi:homocysteine S-methyltransferase family protein [Planctomicrobium sp. SH664]|uniref:homocysteine S-methyltransferase family protein n=1 Tax=Planctomicrobium sp. SH664 TaxID=3448125 RepID=UPI003F5C8A67